MLNMYVPNREAVDGMKPESCVVNGTAKMPAPTVVPAIMSVYEDSTAPVCLSWNATEDQWLMMQTWLDDSQRKRLNCRA